MKLAVSNELRDCWHKWFAWYPVWVTDGDGRTLIWWEACWRRRNWWRSYEYRIL